MNLLTRLSAWYHKLAEHHNPDKYLEVGAKPTLTRATETKEIEIPDYLRGSDIPDFGKDQERMLRRAIILYPDEVNRKKWLKSVYVLGDDWVMKGGKAKFGQGAADNYGRTTV